MNGHIPAEPVVGIPASQTLPGQDVGSLTQRLVRLLGEQQERAGRLDRLSIAQSTAVLSQQFDAVNELLAARDPVVAELQRGAEECRAVADAMLAGAGVGRGPGGSRTPPAGVERLVAVVAVAAAEHREPLETAAARLDSTLMAIERRDAADHAALKTFRDEVARQLSDTVVTRNAAEAYGGLNTPLGVVYQDRHG